MFNNHYFLSFFSVIDLSSNTNLNINYIATKIVSIREGTNINMSLNSNPVIVHTKQVGKIIRIDIKLNELLSLFLIASI